MPPLPCWPGAGGPDAESRGGLLFPRSRLAAPHPLAWGFACGAQDPGWQLRRGPGPCPAPRPRKVSSHRAQPLPLPATARSLCGARTMTAQTERGKGLRHCRPSAGPLGGQGPRMLRGLEVCESLRRPGLGPRVREPAPCWCLLPAPRYEGHRGAQAAVRVGAWAGGGADTGPRA